MNKKHIMMLLLLLAYPLITTALPPPTTCPSAKSIKNDSLLFDSSGCMFDGTCYCAAMGYHFDTTTTWNVIVWVHDPLETKRMSAKSGARKALPSLVFKEGPIQLDNGRWACSYDNEFGYKIRLVQDKDSKK